MLLWALDATAEESAGKIPVIAAHSSGMGGFVSLVATTVPITGVGSSSGDILVWDPITGTFVTGSESVSYIRRLLEEIVVLLTQMRDLNLEGYPLSQLAQLAIEGQTRGLFSVELH